MKNENYIVIQGWMRNDLHLKGNELMVYALIYGFSQDGEDEFTGSISYISEWIGATKQTVFTALKALVDKGLLCKEEVYNNGVKFCKYKTLPVVKNFDEGVVKKFDGGSQKSLSNNIDNNIDNKNIEYVVKKYNSTSMPKCIKLTDNRKKKILKRIKDFGVDGILQAFQKVDQSSFLSGRDGKWQCNLDWLIKCQDNMAKVLEGAYDDKKKCDDDPEAKRVAEIARQNHEAEVEQMVEREKAELMKGVTEERLKELKRRYEK